MAIAMVIPFLLAGPAYADAAEDIAVQPPEITVILLNNQQVADGLLFVAPKVAAISGGTSPTPVGPEIVDNKGRPVWFLPVTNGQSAADFRVQKYHNRPGLTWAQEQGFGGLVQNESVDYIFDSSYQLVATVHAGNGLNADALPYSRVMWVEINPLTGSAALVRSIQHPEGLSAASQGGS